MLLLLLGAAAHGHAGGSIAAIDVDASDPALSVLEGNFGLLLDDGTGWRWVCHEAITTAEATLSPRYVRAHDGVLLAVIPDDSQARDPRYRVYRSDDGGCSWPAVEALADQPVVALAASPLDPSLWLAATEDDGALLASQDGGLSWSEVLAPVEGRRYTRVELSASGAAWASGQDADGSLVIAHDADGVDGLVAHRHAPPQDEDGVGEVELVLLASSPTEPGRAWLGAGPTTRDVLWTTADGGQGVQVLQAFDGELTDGGVAQDGAVWVLEGSRAPWRSADGASFEAISGVPLGIGLQTAGTAALTTSFAEYTGVLLTEVQPDGSWAAVVRPPDLAGPLACRDNTEQREICEALWSEVEASLSIFEPADTGEGGQPEGDGGTAQDSGTAQAEGCSCTTGGAGASGPGLLVGLLAGVYRRRTPRRGLQPRSGHRVPDGISKPAP